MPRGVARTRRRGTGSITSYTTKAGTRWRWQLMVPVDVEYPEGGARLAGQGGFKTAADADDSLQLARGKLRAQQTVRSAGPPTIGVYVWAWLDGLRLENSTIHGYKKIARNHIVPQLGSTRLDQLTATRLARHYRELGVSGRKDVRGFGLPLSANTISKVHVLIGAMLDAAVDDGHVPTNVARKSRTVQAPTGKQVRSQQTEISTWSASELRAFLEWDRLVHQDELFALWFCISRTGMRRSEALALRWGDLDNVNQRVSIRRAADVTQRNVTKGTKTGGSRVVDLDAETVEILKGWKAERGSVSLDLARAGAYMFGDDTGAMRSPTSVTERWRRRVREAQAALGIDQLPTLTIKGLRHTHATLLLELGVHPKVVQERLGHSNISTTMNIYSHVTPTMQRDAVARLQQLFTS